MAAEARPGNDARGYEPFDNDPEQEVGPEQIEGGYRDAPCARRQSGNGTGAFVAVVGVSALAGSRT